MGVSRNRLSLLFHRYYHGTATEQEKNEMIELIRQAGDDAELSALMNAEWKNLEADKPLFSSEIREQMIGKILGRSDRQIAGQKEEIALPTARGLVLRWWHWAAAVLVLAGFGAFLRMNLHKQAQVVSTTAQPVIKPAWNRATLTLADGSVVSLDTTATGAMIWQGAARISKEREGELVYNQAKESAPGSTSQMNTISTPRGGQYQISLPDGTKAWLNASSSIRFPVAFGSSERRIEVEGEVYFQVKKDKLRPFRVVFGNNEIEVLGTSFNVMNYKEERISRTTLEEGSLIVKAGHQQSKLRPGEQASIAGEGALAVAQVDVEEAIAWKDGLFQFQDAGIEEVMREVARWYDVEVRYKGPVPRKQFTGTIGRNLNISELMNMLQYAGVNYAISGREITITN